MVGWSQLHTDVENIPCTAVAHPWTENCLLAAAHTWAHSFIGSAGFFGLLYLCQYVSVVLKKKKKADPKDFLRRVLRSTVFGSSLATGTFAFHCIFRKLFGKFYFHTLVFVPASLAGFSIYLDCQKARELFTNALGNCCLEYWIKYLEDSKILKWNYNIQTIIFMTLSSVLSSLISWTKFDLNYYWFFLPPKVEKTENDSNCFHKGTCIKHISNLFMMYSTTGLILQFLRLFFNNVKNLRIFFSSLRSPKAYKLAAFLGGYVVLYQAIRCFLYQKEKRYSLFHDSLAGFLAGIAFRFRPTIPIFNSALITIIQILTEMGSRKKILPNIPYLELSFALFCGLLFHWRILGDYCPSLMVYFMSSVTHGLSDKFARTVFFVVVDIFLFCCLLRTSVPKKSFSVLHIIVLLSFCSFVFI